MAAPLARVEPDDDLGGPPQAELDVSRVFGKEVTAAQRALVAKVANGLALDFAAALLPFGPFVIDRRLKQWAEEAEPQPQPST